MNAEYKRLAISLDIERCFITINNVSAQVQFKYLKLEKLLIDSTVTIVLVTIHLVCMYMGVDVLVLICVWGGGV